MTSMPSYDTVRGETLDTLQGIVDALPGESEVQKNPEGTPYPCGDGRRFTGTWTVAINGDFDSEAFLRELPASAGEQFELDDAESPVDDTVYLRVPQHGDMSVSITDLSTDDAPRIGLTAISRCGQAPDA